MAKTVFHLWGYQAQNLQCLNPAAVKILFVAAILKCCTLRFKKIEAPACSTGKNGGTAKSQALLHVHFLIIKNNLISVGETPTDKIMVRLKSSETTRQSFPVPETIASPISYTRINFSPLIKITI